MKKIVDNLFVKFLGILVVVMFIVGLKEAILTDKDLNYAFMELMGVLPFSEFFATHICTILGYQYELPVISNSSFIVDLIKLGFMAFFRPLVFGLLSTIFLKIPSQFNNNQSYYMDGLQYKIKELILVLITTPILALLSSIAATSMMSFFANKFGEFMSCVLGSLATLVLGSLSLIPLLIAGTAIMTAVLWRILVTFVFEIVKTLTTTVMCLLVYIAFLGGIPEQISVSIISLIVIVVLMDIVFKCLQYSIVGATRK